MPDEPGQVPEARGDLRAEPHEGRRHGQLHCRANPLGVVVGQLEGGEDAHVVGDEVGAIDLEDVEEGEQVAESGLTLDPRIVGDGPAGPAQIGADGSVAAFGENGSDGAPLPPVLRKSVQQHHGFTVSDGSNVRLQAGSLGEEMVEAGSFGQRRRPRRGLGAGDAGLGRGHGDPLSGAELLFL